MAGALGDFKRGFFDRPAVQNAVDKAIRKALSRAGAFVRTRARSSLRRRKKASQPGSPPSVHSRDVYATLKNVLFSYDAAKKSVVVGMPLLNGRPRSGTTVPELHEEGGTAGVVEVQLSGGKWVAKSYGKRWGENRPHRTRQARYPQRPTMGPALKAEQARIAEQLRNSVRA